ncbi:MAG: signal peptidase II [Armatimonadota bacterium]|nr:signal peptidase II [Armatimonadota bacterium]MDR7520198.1 signal peptidase II [Armatimonadota bacterium]MDR7549729.1 signal peptidase II [Armatimonadota bacterium]
MLRRRDWHGPVLGAVAVAAADQAIKALVSGALPPSTSVPVIPGVLSLTHVQNTGVAFGLFAGLSPVVTALAALTLLLVLFYNRGRWLASRTAGVGMAAMAGGAAGNLFDRARLGYVVDYLDLHVWPVFNIADVAVVIGAGVLVLALSREGRAGQAGR